MVEDRKAPHPVRVYREGEMIVLAIGNDGMAVQMTEKQRNVLVYHLMNPEPQP